MSCCLGHTIKIAELLTSCVLPEMKGKNNSLGKFFQNRFTSYMMPIII